MISPVLFSSRPDLVQALAEDPSVAAVVVDWERAGKSRRQRDAQQLIGTDTQIGTDTAADLQRVADVSNAPVWCRINPVSSLTFDEVEWAIEGGASEILVPMVTGPAEVEKVLGFASDRVAVGILIETPDALEQCRTLAELPLARMYVGLMDLAIGRASTTIFEPFLDGTLSHLRDVIEVPMGVGGLTVPGGGSPIPAELLAGEMVSLGCDFSFLRRSFIMDASADPRRGLAEVNTMLERLERRDAVDVERDSSAFRRLVAGFRT